MTQISQLNIFNKKSRPANSLINTEISKITSKIGNDDIINIMMQNPYEKMNPMNLWFYDDNYRIIDAFENEQNMRIRYYKNLMLTPLLTKQVPNLQHLKFLNMLSMYQPFYPETFFQTWEILQTKYLNNKVTNFLHIGRENSSGTMEAIMLYQEKYNQKYLNNKYHYWYAGKEIYDIHTDSYNLMKPVINYLGQTYPIKFMETTTHLEKYDFVSIDCIHLFSSLFKWKEEEFDLHANLFYVLFISKFLKPGGSILLKTNLLCSDGWFVLMKVISNLFTEHIWIRSTLTNPLNSEVFLLVSNPRNQNLLNSVYYTILKNLYKNKMYYNFHINESRDLTNKIVSNFTKCSQQWFQNLTTHMNHYPQSMCNDKKINNWCIKYELPNIMSLGNYFDNKLMCDSVRYVPTHVSCVLTLGSVDDLLESNDYKKLLNKKMTLNFHKRVMDSKPSQIFTSKYEKNPSNELITWENLMDRMDQSKNLKYTLKTDFNAEMVTNAWIKMYELMDRLLAIYNLPYINTFHLCEAPGAFISSINHHTYSNKYTNWTWYAQTLKPGDNTALDDHFGLIAYDPTKWLFGPESDNSGDITHSKVIRYYSEYFSLKKINFMTADAGLHCDPQKINEQESYLAKINMGQIIAILACLEKRGTAVFKTFLPLTEPLNISMIYLTSQLFASVQFIKPEASNSDNSEVYVILDGYKGIDSEILDVLYTMLDDPEINSGTLLFNDISKIFLKKYSDCIIPFIDRQIHSLQKSYYYYYHYEQLPNTDHSVIYNWFNKHKVLPLNNESKLIKV